MIFGYLIQSYNIKVYMMTLVPKIITCSSFSCIFLVLICLLMLQVRPVEYNSNFNLSKVNDVVIGDPISLPIIISATTQRKVVHTPTQVTTSSQPSSPIGGYAQDGYRLKRYQLKDTQYKPEQHQLNDIQQNIIYNMQPPASLFDVNRVITIEDYQLLQIRNIRMVLINPTDKFRFCINEIYTDSQSIKRIQQKKLPFCLNPNNKYPFFFNLYITEHKPLLFRTSIYFIISIYDGYELVDEKIWPRQIIAKVSQNHLKLTPFQVRNCGSGQSSKNHTTLTVSNPHPHHIRISFQNQHNIQDKNANKEIMIPSQKNFKMPILSKQTIFAITSRGFEGTSIDSKYPKLYLPIFCVRPLQINHFHIGVLNTERSILQILVPVTNNAKQAIQIKSIQAISSSQTVEVLPLPGNENRVQAGIQHYPICRLLAHIPKQFVQKTIIQVKIIYFLQSNPKQLMQSRNTYKFYELRNPLSLGARRFIDVKRIQEQDSIMNSIFPIRNNLNLPLLLIRVIFDEKIFKLTWLKDRRQHIYPNQQRDQFSLQYIGPRYLNISPIKYIMMLQFNGNLIIPIQIIVYDHTIQCVHNSIQQKCQNLGVIDYGYFRNSTPKTKPVIFRNWNPVPKEVKIRFKQNTVQLYGMMVTMNISRPSPDYDILFKNVNNSILFYLKGNHHITVYFTVTPLKNATSGQPIFQIITESQHIFKRLKFKVQNGTIALIPQILRIGSAYDHAVEYLNLVSTFSQPYKIKNTYVNNSFISVYFNNNSEILENQWIGLALVYNPFQSNATQSKSTTSTGPLSTSTSTVIPPTNPAKLTQNCCGHEFMINSFINQLYHNEYRRLTHVSVRVVTTTQLQTNATIIIDNNPPKMIAQDNFIIEMIKYSTNNKNGKNGNNNNNDGKSKESKDYFIKVKNVFKEFVKFRPIIVPKFLYEDTKQFLSSMRRVRKTYDNAMLCVNNAISIKHNFSPQMVKTILDLDLIPQQITIQPLDNEEYYVGSQRKNRFDSSAPELTSYVRKTVEDGARVCYKMNITKYLKQLIQSHVINDIAQNYSSQIFHQFVQKQMQFNNFNNTPLYYLEEDQFYDSLEYNFDHYCKKSIYPFFRFCKQIGVTVLPTNQVILQPGNQTQITIRAASKYKQSSQSLYIILLNNITKYQAHLVQINITQPKLKIKKLYFPQQKPQKNSQNENETENPVLKSTTQQTFVKRYLTKKDLSKMTKIKQLDLQDNDITKKSISNAFPVILTHLDIKNQKYQTERIITLMNVGNIDIKISHIGFFSQQRICAYKGINISQQFCNGFIIKSGKQFNFTIRVDIDQNLINQFNSIDLYLYQEEAFYFKINLFVKAAHINGGNSFHHKSMNSLVMNLISFIYIVLVILRLKSQIDQKQKSKKINFKTKIMNPSNYLMLGTRIEKKVRKLQPIPQDQITAVKQIQQIKHNRIKQFFNSSDQSEIAKRQHTEQQQPSNNQILTALKQERNSMSASQESSIDFIDLNALNKSSQNIDEKQVEELQSNDKELQPNDNQMEANDGSQQRQSQADSNFNEGDEIDYSNVKQDYGWGNPIKQNKKQQQTPPSYYNVFSCPNPLKKNENTGPFHWLNDNYHSRR